jgi:hypothetical protein
LAKNLRGLRNHNTTNRTSSQSWKEAPPAVGGILKEETESPHTTSLTEEFRRYPKTEHLRYLPLLLTLESHHIVNSENDGTQVSQFRGKGEDDVMWK